MLLAYSSIRNGSRTRSVPKLRSLVVVGRKNYVFAGSERGAEKAATFYCFIKTAKLDDIDAELEPRDVLTRIAGHPTTRPGDLLLWNLMPLAAVN